MQDQVLVMLRDRVADIIFGTVFLFGGLAACGIAAMRRRSGVRDDRSDVSYARV